MEASRSNSFPEASFVSWAHRESVELVIFDEDAVQACQEALLIQMKRLIEPIMPWARLVVLNRRLKVTQHSLHLFYCRKS